MSNEPHHTPAPEPAAADVPTEQTTSGAATEPVPEKAPSGAVVSIKSAAIVGAVGIAVAFTGAGFGLGYWAGDSGSQDQAPGVTRIVPGGQMGGGPMGGGMLGGGGQLGDGQAPGATELPEGGSSEATPSSAT